MLRHQYTQQHYKEDNSCEIGDYVLCSQGAQQSLFVSSISTSDPTLGGSNLECIFLLDQTHLFHAHISS